MRPWAGGGTQRGAPGPAGPPQGTSIMAQPSAPRPGAILLIEDCYDVRIGLAQLLAMNGYRVTDAPDGKCAIAELSANPHGFALILLDLLLPGAISGNDVRARQLADP